MKCYSLSHLADHVLLRELAVLVTQDRVTTAALLAHLAEVDDRKLYLPAAHASMYSYCVRVLRMSEDTAFKRIRVARTARQFPAILAAIADGRLNLSAVVLLAPHLTPDIADDLLAAAAHKNNAQIELLLARRFPRPDLPTLVQAITPAGLTDELDLRQVNDPALQLAVRPVVPSVESDTLVQTVPLVSRTKLAPLSPGRYALQLTVDQATYDQLRYAQALLGHAVPSGAVEQVLKRALDSLVQQLEQQKFARSARSRPRQQSSAAGRHVPAEIRRTVWQRDGGQCTFVSDRGQRCEERTRLEFDHVEPVARGGATTVAGVRLRCRAHNQYAAECAFGAGFMRAKREEARCRAAQEKAETQAQATAEAKAHEKARAEAAAEAASLLDVTPWLRKLGFTVEEARRGVALCAHLPDGPLEERVRVALRGLAPNCARRAMHGASGPA